MSLVTRPKCVAYCTHSIDHSDWHTESTRLAHSSDVIAGDTTDIRLAELQNLKTMEVFICCHVGKISITIYTKLSPISRIFRATETTFDYTFPVSNLKNMLKKTWRKFYWMCVHIQKHSFHDKNVQCSF